MSDLKDILSTLEEVIRRHGEDKFIRWKQINYPSDEQQFVARLYAELKGIVERLEASAHDKQNDDEDKLTRYVVDMVHQTGYNATHDQDQKGHTDLIIWSQNFKWLGEAKRHRDYEWLFHGLKQIQTYATGREVGYGLLIYLFGTNAKAVMDEWRTRLSESSNSYVKSINDGTEPLTFWSIHQHQASGADMNTKHIGVSMYYASPTR
jgi:hypothetical protein